MPEPEPEAKPETARVRIPASEVNPEPKKKVRKKVASTTPRAGTAATKAGPEALIPPAEPELESIPMTRAGPKWKRPVPEAPRVRVKTP